MYFNQFKGLTVAFLLLINCILSAQEKQMINLGKFTTCCEGTEFF